MFWEFFIRNPKFAYLFLVALIGIGSYSIIAIPRESAPEVQIPVGVVTTILPGAPAADIETLITNEVERGLSGLQNVKKITSQSREGVSSVVVEFDASADIDESIADLKDEVDKIKTSLPSDAEDPNVSEINFVDQPVMTVALAGDLSPLEFNQLANLLEDELEVLPNISKVTFSGVQEREVTIIIDQASLSQYKLSLSEVTNAISAANRTLPIGEIVNNSISYNVAFEGDITEPQQILDIAVAVRGDQPVYVRDIAQVIDGLAPANALSRLSNEGAPSQPSISLDVYKQRGGDITAITARVAGRIAELQQPGQLLDGVASVTVLDAGDDIKKDLVNLSSSGLQTVALVVFLLILTIGWREGIIAGFAIPLSFLIGFIGLYASGNTINFLSLFALILGIGILVDSAIVMIEGINSRMKQDPTIDKKEAAILTIREFAAPLISGTLTTVAMFVGLFIVSGVIGQFISSIPFTLIFILFASLFVALAIVPLFASKILRRRTTSSFERTQIEYAHRLESWYRTKLVRILASEQKQDSFLALIAALLILSLLLVYSLFAGIIASILIYVTYKWRYRFNRRRDNPSHAHAVIKLGLWLVTTVASVAVAVLIAMQLPTVNPVKVIFFEQGDVDFLIVTVEQAEGTQKEITDRTTRRIEEILLTVPDIESYVVTVGSGSQFAGGGSGEKLANIFITLRFDRALTSTELIEQLRAKVSTVKEAKISVTQPSDGPPTGAAIIIKYLGNDLVELSDAANKTAELLKSIPHTTNVDTSTASNNSEFVLELDRAKTASLGLNPFTVSQLARTAVFGTEATSLTTLTDDIPVMVKLNLDAGTSAENGTTNQATIDALTRIEVPVANGTVPLSTLVAVSLREANTAIAHEDGKRTVSITADVTAEGNAREIQAEALARVASELNLPASIEMSTGGGESDESNQAFIEMLLALIVGVMLMVAILTYQFNSYLHTAYVLSILPYSLIGIMAGLALTQNPLSFPSIMGFIALSGIVVNNSILLIDMMNQSRRSNPDVSLQDAVISASVSRLRPILLTSLTTIIGMIPLVFAGDLWAPLAYAVMFGLMFSVIITLVLIPIIYSRKPGELG